MGTDLGFIAWELMVPISAVIVIISFLIYLYFFGPKPMEMEKHG